MNSITTNSTLLLPEVQAVLERLHTLADTNDAMIIQQIADDVELFQDELAPDLDYIRNPAHGFVSVTLPLEDGIEYSVKL